MPDGDMRDDARCWEILFLDALLSMEELRAEAIAGDAEAIYSLGVRLFRRGDADRAALPGLPANLEADPVGQLRGVLEIARLVRRGDIYAVARRQYGDFDLYENLLWDYSRRYTRYHEGVLAGWGHDGAPEAFREYRRATGREPPTVEDLTKWVDMIAAAKREDRWDASNALRELDRWLPFCTVRIAWLRGEERKREIGKLVRWLRDVRGTLEFDRTVGVYVVR